MGVPVEKPRLSVRTAASGPPRPNRVSGADAHTAALRAAQARVDELEAKLADLLVPILEAAGRKAASNFRARAPVGMVAALTAAGPGVESNSTMVALKPRAAEAEALALSASIPAETLHVTLAYLGEIDGPLEPIAAALAAVAANHAPLVGEVAGGGFFGHVDQGGPTILLPDVAGLVELRVDVSEALTTAAIPYSRDHGFQPHVTVAYRGGEPQGEFPPEVDYRPSTDPEFRCATCLRFDGARGVCVMFDAPAEPEMVCDEWTDEPYDPIGETLHFDSLLVVRGDSEIVEIPLVGVPPLTAASPPNWVPPAGDEILDVDTLVKTLRTKTDPVRRALLEASMKPGLASAGLDFDVTNPFTAKVLSRAGQNVRSIAVTTQLNVMRSIKSAYSNGLSIPDTAALIQAGMSAAAPARATMIARTELAGAVNGGSLAATQIVSDVTGDRYVKRWLTAPGAVYPRHELYEGLDGQEQPLDGLFEVGGSPLMFPGDPDGDPGETINCFPAETLVSMPKLRAVTRRWYEGDLVRIRTAAGHDLAGTPNHPVLRADGKWVPLGELREGDQLVRAEILRSYEGAPDPRDPPASIGEIYRLSEMTGDPERVRLTPPDLHGDGADGEVDVVAVDRNLLVDGQAATDEEIAEFGFALAYGARSGSGGRDHSASGDFRGRHVSGSLAPTSFVGVDRESTSLVRVETSHTEAVRFRASPDGKSEIFEPSENRRTADVESLRDREDGLSILVSLADLVEVEVEPFHGYVYTLDTGDGWFTAGSILVRNCRCTLVYNSPEGEGEASAEDAPPDLSDAGAAAAALGVTPADAPATLAPADVLSIQGGTRGALVEQRRTVESAVGNLGELIRLPDRANLPADGVKVTMRRNQTSRGHFKTWVRSTGPDTREVEKAEINVGSPAHPAVTLAHEFGHLLDSSYIGENPFALATKNISAVEDPELRAALKELDAAWKNSQAYKTLDRNGDSLSRYYRSRPELWARSFSQWAAERSPADSPLSQEMARDIAKEAEKVAELGGVPGWRFYPEFWQPGDFDEIRPAIERVLRAAGLLAS